MLSAVVLAAGRSSRLGRPKLVLKVGGEPILGMVLKALRESSVNEVVVVLGGDAGAIRSAVKFEQEKIVSNPGYESGMSSSLKLGLVRASEAADAVVIVLGDQPFLSAHTVDKLADGFRRAGARIVVPVFHGRRGNPVLFAKSMFNELMEINGDFGAKSVVSAHADEVLEVDVRDPGVLFDVDTPSDHLRAVTRRGKVTRKRKQARA